MLLPRGRLFSGRESVAPLSVHQLNRTVHATAEIAGIKKRDIQGGHPRHAGNGFLMRRGFNLVWSGWQGDVPRGADRLTARFPTGVTGTVREEFTAEATAGCSATAISRSSPRSALLAR